MLSINQAYRETGIKDKNVKERMNREKDGGCVIQKKIIHKQIHVVVCSWSHPFP